jgi:hypothetical protein
MNYRFYIVISLLFSITFGQNIVEKNGIVQSITHENIYVKFDNTQGITINDTLYQSLQGKYIPVLIVKQISTNYLLTKKFENFNLNQGDKIIAIIIQSTNDTTQKSIIDNVKREPIKNINIATKASSKYIKQQIKGRINVSMFNNYNDSFSERKSLRLKQKFSMNAINIADSKLSFTSYFNTSYRQNVRNDETLESRYLRVYDLAFRYDLSKTTSLIAGRKINPTLSNIGAIDGIQIYKSGDNYSGGLILGSRPDFNDFGYNKNLFEAGIYGSHSSIDKSKLTSIALTQQMNGKSIDRRSLYFTQQNKISDQLRYYVNGELDLYEKINNIAKTSLKLTGLYISTTYKPSRTLSVSTSYNSRKNIIYYETFKSYAEQLYNDETRHGIRMRVNWKAKKYVYLNLNSGYRFRNGDKQSSYNYSGSLSHSQLPILRGLSRVTLSYLTSNYLEGKIMDFYISKNLFKGFLTVSSRYKYVDYQYVNSEATLTQHLISSDLSWQLKSKLSFTMSYNGSFENELDYNQVYFIISQRF